MKYTKPALTFDEQLALLESRGLVVANRTRALRWLKRVGYYRLSGYSYAFKKPGGDNFQDGFSFDDIIRLYKFDCRLRLLFLQAIDRLEISVRTAITYELAHSLGPFGYCDYRNFSSSFDHAEFMKKLQQEEERASELFLTHFRSKYTSEPRLPVWMMTEIVSFGALSKLTKHAHAAVRKSIGKQFHLPEHIFMSWIHTLSLTRNLCAHHNRLWNRTLRVRPIALREWGGGVSTDRVYAVALIVQHLLSVVAPQSKWADRLKAACAEAPPVVLSVMRFPTNWEALKEWQ